VDLPEDTHRYNIIGDNAGNLVFSHATHRILSTRDAEIVSNGFRADAATASRINNDYDAFVVPLANAFRPSFKHQLVKLTHLIQQLRIPVVVVGVGAQVNVSYSNAQRLSPIEDEVKAFVSAVLDRSATIGVRGEFTESYLHGLGFRNVDVIGCPSLFGNGPDLRVEKKSPALTRDAKLAINVTPYVKHMGQIVRDHYEWYPNLMYVPQDHATLGLMLWGETPEEAAIQDDLPTHMSHPLYRENKMRFFVEPQTWIDFLAGYEFSFGSRIHGNIVSLIAGTPAVLLAHDSRTLELAKYHEIPYRLVADLPEHTDAADLYSEADYTGFNKGHQERFERFTAFLEWNGLRHIFMAGESGAAYDERARTVPFPPPVETLSSPDTATVAARMRRLNESNEQLRAQIAESRRLGRLADRAKGKIRSIIRG
jgi:polysaccharide pyruvyl transferase